MTSDKFMTKKHDYNFLRSLQQISKVYLSKIFDKFTLQLDKFTQDLNSLQQILRSLHLTISDKINKNMTKKHDYKFFCDVYIEIQRFICQKYHIIERFT